MGEYIWRFKLEETKQTSICQDLRTEFLRRTMAEILELVQLYDAEGNYLLPKFFTPLTNDDDNRYPIYTEKKR